MKKVTRRVSLDFTRKNSTRVSFASESDFGSREFIISLTDDGAPYPVDRHQSAMVNVWRNDQESRAYSAEVTADGCVRFLLPLWALEIAGETALSVSLYDGNNSRLTSMPFKINVERALYLGDEITQASDSFNAFHDAMNDLAKIKSEEVDRVDAEDARAKSEEERRYAEGSVYSGSIYYGGRALAELLRQTEEGFRVDAEKTRKDSESARVSQEEMRRASEEKRNQAEGSLNTGSNYYGGRVLAEHIREAAERGRYEEEARRSEAEAERLDAEEKRKYAEGGLSSSDRYYGGRKLAEYLRDVAEQMRDSAEKQRVEAEKNREGAEAERKKTISEVETQIGMIQQALDVIISIQESLIGGDAQ